VIDAYSWCSPCKILSPILEKLTGDADMRTGSGRPIDLVTFDTEEHALCKGTMCGLGLWGATHMATAPTGTFPATWGKLGIKPSPLRKRAYTTHQMSRVRHHRHLIWVSLYTTTAMQVWPVDLGCLSQRSLDVPRFSVRHPNLSCHARRWSTSPGNG
jgi:hypothetical protein